MTEELLTALREMTAELRKLNAAMPHYVRELGATETARRLDAEKLELERLAKVATRKLPGMTSATTCVRRWSTKRSER